MRGKEVRTRTQRLVRLSERSRWLSVALRIALYFRHCYRWAKGRLVRSTTIRRYLGSHQVTKLQIGAGFNTLNGWLNTDVDPSSPGVMYLDATRPFPLADMTFDYVFSEHLIEHLTYRQGLSMLRECHRVLKPGGRIRIATPDLETLLGLCAPEKSELQQRYIRWITDKFLPQAGAYRESFVINNAFQNWGHRFIYDGATLQAALEEVGFVDITRHAAGESDDNALRGIESHGEAAGDEEMNRFETLVLEARR